MGYARFARGFLGINVLLALTFIGCGGVASFDTPFTLYTSIVSADLNGDGRLDIAMSSSYLSGSPPHSGHAVVLLRNPAPAEGFSPAVRYDAGSDPDVLLVRDINGDGKPDLVVADTTLSANAGGTGKISILLQDPADPGNFLPATDYATGMRSRSIAIGDLNGDGKADIAVADEGAVLYYQDPDRVGIFIGPIRTGP